MKLEKNIILCGFMGCGKSTVGKLLAQKLDAEFIDMDEYIEAREQKSVADMFAIYGEAGFREREHAAVLELSQKQGTVIAAGGGALLFKRNADALRKNGAVVFLDCGFETCYSRIASSDRPIVQSKSKEELKTLYLERRELYPDVSDFVLTSEADTEKRAGRIAKMVVDGIWI